MYSSLFSLCSRILNYLWIAALLLGLACPRSSDSGQGAMEKVSRGEKVEERKRKRGGFLPSLRSLSSSPTPSIFSGSLFFAPCPLFERCIRSVVAGVKRLTCGRKKEGHQNYDCLIQGGRAGISDLPYPSFRGTCTVAICNNHRTL